jgi:DNA-binding NtrC family response regulator
MATQEILLVEDSADDAFLVRRTIDNHLPGRFLVNHKMTMADAEAYMKNNKGRISLVLLDLGLPDTRDGRDTFNRMKNYAPEIPIVILTGTEDHELALSLIREGAEDFMNKGHMREKPEMLRDMLDFAACRHQLMGDMAKKHEESIKDKEEIISWMNGGYSIRP